MTAYRPKKPTKTNNPNCYECHWRTGCEGSAHSQCLHPYNKEQIDDPMLQLMGIFASVGRVGFQPIADERLRIVGNSSGIAKGWFHYPVNFDPVWLENCDGFKKIADDHPRASLIKVIEKVFKNFLTKNRQKRIGELSWTDTQKYLLLSRQ